MILWIYEYKKNIAKREQFEHALFIEKAYHILSKTREEVEGEETIMETCLRQIREFGESVTVIDQEPSKMSHSIKANTYTNICFNLGNGADVYDMATCMFLNVEQREYIDHLWLGHRQAKRAE